jgi:hypothetical protein
MTHFDFNIRPFYPDWGIPINEFYSDSFKRIYLILNPFIKVPITYDKNLIEHNIWAEENIVGDNTIDYPSNDFILKNCFEITWKEIMRNACFKSINEINYALINNGLNEKFQNKELAEKLYAFCNSNSTYYPPDGDFTPFNTLKTIKLIKDLGIDKIELLSEFGDDCIELKITEIDKMIGLNLRTVTIYSVDKNLLFTNHWDSYMTIIATNYDIGQEILENEYGFETIKPGSGFKLDLR